MRALQANFFLVEFPFSQNGKVNGGAFLIHSVVRKADGVNPFGKCHDFRRQEFALVTDNILKKRDVLARMPHKKPLLRLAFCHLFSHHK